MQSHEGRSCELWCKEEEKKKEHYWGRKHFIKWLYYNRSSKIRLKVVTELFAFLPLILLGNLWAINSHYSQPTLRKKKIVIFKSSCNIHWCAKIKDEVEKLAYQLNEETERTERPIRRLSKVMYGSTCADMQVDVMGECLSSIKHVVGVRSVFLAKRLHAV
ncbi:uncharacterized protein TNCV_4604191 [Trichonephila clavipes]|nr:uncharacterized protein TNCV_4604191 [Trichonephila clavipes]